MRPKSSNPRSAVFAFRTDVRTARRIRQAAAADDRRPSAFLRRAIERLLAESASVSAAE